MTSTHSQCATWLTRRFSPPSAKHRSVLETQILLEILSNCAPWILKGKVINWKCSGFLMTSEVKEGHSTRPMTRECLAPPARDTLGRPACCGGFPRTLHHMKQIHATGRWLSNFGLLYNHLEALSIQRVSLHPESDSIGLGQSRSICFSKEFPGGAGVAGLETILCKPLRENSLHSFSLTEARKVEATMVLKKQKNRWQLLITLMHFSPESPVKSCYHEF